MGAADIVPACPAAPWPLSPVFYDTLLASIRAVDLEFLRRVIKLDIAGAWRMSTAVSLALLAGIATSVFSLARGSAGCWSITRYRCGRFFGDSSPALVLLSGGQTLERRPGRQPAGGRGRALAIALSPVFEMQAGLTGVFLAGFPGHLCDAAAGYLGSFILVLLGMYGTVLSAIRQLDLLFIAVFAFGAGCGLPVFFSFAALALQRFRIRRPWRC
ncbi:MAG: DUF368 domain-containing protein [Halioglobus sp.]